LAIAAHFHFVSLAFEKPPQSRLDSAIIFNYENCLHDVLVQQCDGLPIKAEKPNRRILNYSRNRVVIAPSIDFYFCTAILLPWLLADL
jgi:hypothetical protein